MIKNVKIYFFYAKYLRILRNTYIFVPYNNNIQQQRYEKVYKSNSKHN